MKRVVYTQWAWMDEGEHRKRTSYIPGNQPIGWEIVREVDSNDPELLMFDDIIGERTLEHKG